MEIEKSIGIRVLPQNIEAEIYLLSALLIDPESFEKLLDMSSKISSDDFFDLRHKYIFQAIESLKKKNIPLDIITLTEELTNSKLLEKAGSIEYINDLLDKIPTSANIEYYSEIIKSKSMLRRLIQICNETIVKSLETQTEVDLLVDETEKRIFDINEEKHISSISHIKNNLYEIIEHINRSSTGSGEISGIPSGYYKLDEITDGFHKSELIVVAARPSLGKTSFALNVASRTSTKFQYKIGVFSCEMSKISLVTRMLCSEASVDQSRYRRNMLKNE